MPEILGLVLLLVAAFLMGVACVLAVYWFWND